MNLKDLIKIALAMGLFAVGVQLYAADGHPAHAHKKTPERVLPASR